MTRTAFALVIVSVLLSSAAQILLKAGMAAPSVSGLAEAGSRWIYLVTALTHPMVLAGLAAYGASAIVWLLVLARLDLSMAYPFVALGFVLTALLAWWIHGEVINGSRWLGIGIIAFGVIIIARS